MKSVFFYGHSVTAGAVARLIATVGASGYNILPRQNMINFVGSGLPNWWTEGALPPRKDLGGGAGLAECYSIFADGIALADKVIVFLDYNDFIWGTLGTDESDATQYADVPAFVAFYKQFIDEVVRGSMGISGANILCVFTHPGETSTCGAIGDGTSYQGDTENATTHYNQNQAYLIAEVAPDLVDLGISVYPVFNRIIAEFGIDNTDEFADEYLTDRIHPNNAGNDVFYTPVLDKWIRTGIVTY